jgi:hypothetical protein
VGLIRPDRHVPEWLASQRYAKSYFQKPNLLSTLLPKYLTYIETEFAAFLQHKGRRRRLRRRAQGRRVAVRLPEGQGSRGQLAPMVKGRLLVFFPGSYEDNNYRLLDGYDGWNYLAVPITADKEF